MALAFDAAYSWGWVSSVSSLTVGFATGGANRFLVVGVGTYNASLITVTGVTYGGVAMNRVDSFTAALEGNQQDGEFFWLDNPASGNNNIVITLSGTTSYVAASTASYTGKTSTGIDAHAAAQSLTASLSPTNNVNVVASDCWLVQFGYSRGGSVMGGSGTTMRTTTGYGHGIGDSNGIVSTGDQSLHMGTDSGNVTWPAVLALSFSEATTAGGSSDTPVNPSTGSLTLTGNAPTVARTDNQVVAPSTGALTLAGYAPTVARSEHQSITPATGTLSIAAYTPAVTRMASQAITPGTAILSLAGYAPSVARNAGQLITPDTGTISLDGYAPSLAQTAHRWITPAACAVRIYGHVPTVRNRPQSPTLARRRDRLPIDPNLPINPTPSAEWLSRLNFRLTLLFRDIAAQVNGVSEGSIAACYNAYTNAPTTGTWAQGDFIKNSAPTEQGSVGSKYTVLGWVCTVGGEPGTWLPCRTLTGN